MQIIEDGHQPPRAGFRYSSSHIDESAGKIHGAPIERLDLGNAKSREKADRIKSQQVVVLRFREQGCRLFLRQDAGRSLYRLRTLRVLRSLEHSPTRLSLQN